MAIQPVRVERPGAERRKGEAMVPRFYGTGLPGLRSYLMAMTISSCGLPLAFWA